MSDGEVGILAISHAQRLETAQSEMGCPGGDEIFSLEKLHNRDAFNYEMFYLQTTVRWSGGKWC